MNAKKLLSTLMSAAMAVTMLAGCFGGGGSNYSRQAADAANAAQTTVVFSTDSTLANSLQDALESGLVQTAEVEEAMRADDSLSALLTAGYDLDVRAGQGEDAEAAAQTIVEQYIAGIVSGKQSAGKIAMVLHDGNGYYYVAFLTYGSGSGGFGSGSNGGGTTPGTTGEGGEGGPDDEENNPGGDEPAVTNYTVKVTCDDGGKGSPLGTADPSSGTVAAGEDFVFTVTPVKGQKVSGVTLSGQGLSDDPIWKENSDGTWTVTVPNVQTNIKATVFFAAVDYTVKVTCDDGGKGSPLGTADPSSGTVAAGEDFVFTVTPVKGQKVSGVTLSGQGLSDDPIWKENSDGTWTVTVPNVQTNIKATVFFAAVKPAIKFIEVHQKTNKDGILYVNETLTGKHLNVEAFGNDSDGNIIELEGIELTYDHASQIMFDKATTYSISVTYRDANGTCYTDPAVAITVMERETTEPVVTGVEFKLKSDYDGEYFNGDTIFYQKPGNHGEDHRDREFRNNLEYRFVYEDGSYSEWKDVTQKVVEDHLIAKPDTLTGNGENVNVTISYYERKNHNGKPIGTSVGSDIVKVYVQKSGNSGNN